MAKIIIRFGILAAAFLLLIQLSKYTWISYRMNTEIIVLIMAVVFISLGIFINNNLKKKKEGESNKDFLLNSVLQQKLRISSRELEVLQFMAEGKSNKEIGESLFVSENTIKTHVSNLLMKIGAKRRTEAIKKGKELKLIP